MNFLGSLPTAPTASDAFRLSPTASTDSDARAEEARARERYIRERERGREGEEARGREGGREGERESGREGEWDLVEIDVVLDAR